MSVETWNVVSQYLKTREILFSCPQPEELPSNWRHQLFGESLLLTSEATDRRLGLAIEFVARGNHGLVAEVRYQGTLRDLEEVTRGSVDSRARITSIKRLTGLQLAGDTLIMEGMEENALGRSTTRLNFGLTTSEYVEEITFIPASILKVAAG